MDSYRDGPDHALPRWVRFLLGSFRIGRIFGVEVRVYGLALVLVPLILADAWDSWLFALVGTVALYAVIWSHEMGHVLAGRRYKIHTPLITLSPLGGLAHMQAAPPGPKAEAIVSLCGPATHLLWLAVFWPLSLLTDARAHMWDEGSAGAAAFLVEFLRTTNLGLLLFNILPLFPMDGGRVLRAFLAARMHPNRATILAARIGMVGAVAFAVWGLTRPRFEGGILLAIAISNFLSCMAEVRTARFTPGPYFQGDAFEPWQTDPDAWRGGDAPDAAGDRRPGPIARWRARRREAAEKQRREERAALEESLDRILAKVSEVGMSGLTSEERETLKRAAELRRS